jgi:hypothetical protein
MGKNEREPRLEYSAKNVQMQAKKTEKGFWDF